MTLWSLLILLSLLAFVSIVNAQGSYVIKIFSIPDGGTMPQGASASSGINFTKGNGFVDAVSRSLT
jgi:hypothetical protein